MDFPKKQYLFKAGDKVWIENPNLCNDIHDLRKAQVIESVQFVPMNADAGIYQAIFLVDLPFIYGNEDVKIDVPLDY